MNRQFKTSFNILSWCNNWLDFRTHRNLKHHQLTHNNGTYPWYDKNRDLKKSKCWLILTSETWDNDRTPNDAWSVVATLFAVWQGKGYRTYISNGTILWIFETNVISFNSVVPGKFSKISHFTTNRKPW